MEKVLDRATVKRGCLIEQSSNGLYDLTIIEFGKPVETVRGISLKSAGRAAEAALEKIAARQEGA